MKVINATTIGNLISAHYENNEEKRANDSYKNEPMVTLD